MLEFYEFNFRNPSHMKLLKDNDYLVNVLFFSSGTNSEVHKGVLVECDEPIPNCPDGETEKQYYIRYDMHHEENEIFAQGVFFTPIRLRESWEEI